MSWVAIAIIALFLTAGYLFLRRQNNQVFSPGQSTSSQQGFRRVPPEKGKKVYLHLRNQVLQLSSQELQLPTGFGGDAMVAVLMEMRLQKTVATVAAIADGSASIYLSHGGVFIGGGSHESVRKAGQEMIKIARESQPAMHATKKYPLPKGSEANFYVVTDSGVFTASAREAALRSNHPLTRLYIGGHEVITQYRLISPMRD